MENNCIVFLPAVCVSLVHPVFFGLEGACYCCLNVPNCGPLQGSLWVMIFV